VVRHSFILELRSYTEQDPCYGSMVLWSALQPHIAHLCFADGAKEKVVGAREMFLMFNVKSGRCWGNVLNTQC